MSDLLITAAYGLATLAAIALALFLFGCSMCSLTDDCRAFGPRWAVWIGGITVGTLVVLFVGAMVRFAL